MKSIERRFNTFKDTGLSDMVCFNMAILEQDFKPANIYKWFNKLVDKDDYGKEDKKEIYKSLIKLTTPKKVLRTLYNGGKNALGDSNTPIKANIHKDKPNTNLGHFLPERWYSK